MKTRSCEGHPDSHVFERIEYIGLESGILACFKVLYAEVKHPICL